MGSFEELSLRIRVHLGIISIKMYSTLPRSPKLEPHHQRHFSILSGYRAFVRGIILIFCGIYSKLSRSAPNRVVRGSEIIKKLMCIYWCTWSLQPFNCRVQFLKLCRRLPSITLCVNELDVDLKVPFDICWCVSWNQTLRTKITGNTPGTQNKQDAVVLAEIPHKLRGIHAWRKRDDGHYVGGRLEV